MCFFSIPQNTSWHSTTDYFFCFSSTYKVREGQSDLSFESVSPD